MTKHEEVETILAKIHNTNLALENSNKNTWAEKYWGIANHRLQRQLQYKLNEIDNPQQWIQVVKVTY
jgi:hypothetical protein